MLVLLIIFMVSAPLITTGVVDLPSVGAPAAARKVVEIVVGGDDEREAARRRQGRRAGRAARSWPRACRELQGGDANTPVVISADQSVKYEQVVKVMDTLQRAGVQRVGLSVKQRRLSRDAHGQHASTVDALRCRSRPRGMRPRR